MPTTVTHSIGTASRDYSTIQAWHDAAPVNLVTADQVWRGECYNDTEFATTSTLLTVSGSLVADATRYLMLTVAAGQGYRNNAGAATAALRYDATKGVGLRWTSGYGSLIKGGGQFCLIVDGLQFSYDSTSSSNYSPPLDNIQALHNCIFESRQTANFVLNYIRETVNCVVVARGTSFSGTLVRPSSLTDHHINTTFVRPSDLTAGGTGILGGADGYPVMSNCALFGFTTAFGGTIASYAAGSGNNASDVSSGNIPGSANQASLTASAQFTVSTDASRDWRPKAGGALNTNGSRQNTYTNDLDVINAARSTTTPSIGAREFSVAATQPPVLYRPAQVFVSEELILV